MMPTASAADDSPRGRADAVAKAQMPRLAPQVRERTWTRSMPAAMSSSAFAAVISSLRSTMTSPVSGWAIAEAAKRPMIRSRSDSRTPRSSARSARRRERPAVLLQRNHVLGDVNETTGQVAGVRGAERRVGQTLAGAVRRDEVLQHERLSRKFDLMGSSMMRPEGSDIRPRIPAI